MITRSNKKIRKNVRRLPREVQATLPSWVKCTDPISDEILVQVHLKTTATRSTEYPHLLKRTSMATPEETITKGQDCSEGEHRSYPDKGMKISTIQESQRTWADKVHKQRRSLP